MGWIVSPSVIWLEGTGGQAKEEELGMALREGRASSCLLQHSQGQSSALSAKSTFCPVAHLCDSCQT